MYVTNLVMEIVSGGPDSSAVQWIMVLTRCAVAFCLFVLFAGSLYLRITSIRDQRLPTRSKRFLMKIGCDLGLVLAAISSMVASWMLAGFLAVAIPSLIGRLAQNPYATTILLGVGLGGMAACWIWKRWQDARP